MRKSRFTDAQIVAVVRESEREGVTVAQVAKKHGITRPPCFAGASALGDWIRTRPPSCGACSMRTRG